MNKDALAMVEKLMARLEDVKEVIEECPTEIEGLAKKLDRIDDKLYLVMVEVEKETQKQLEYQKKRESKVVPLNVDKSADSFDASLVDESMQSSVKTSSRVEVPQNSEEDSSEEKKEEKKESFLSDEMKENMKEGARALNGIYQDGKEVVSELSDTMSDIKNIFNFKSKFKK